jgi:hypothetical protein
VTATSLTLTAAEQQLVDAAQAGSRVVVSPRDDGQRQRVRAEVIRQLMLGRIVPTAKLDPRGIQLTGAEITGVLDLSYISCPVRLRLTGCTITDTMYLRGARLPELMLNGCICTPGTGPALHADGLNVDGDVFLDGGFTATSSTELGTVRLLGAHIGGQLSCGGAKLTNTGNGPTLHADGLAIAGDLFLRDGFTATSSTEAGTVRLLGAHIGGQLSCAGAKLTNTDDGPALDADDLAVDGDVFLDGGFTATSSTELGTVRLLGAHIGGQLSCAGAEFTNTGTGPALGADRLNVAGDLFLRDGFTATSSTELGTVRLLGAHIGGQLSCAGAKLTNTGTGPALDADRLTVDGDVFLDGGFTATSSTELGTVRLLGAHIGGQLSCFGAEFTNTGTGPALDAEGLTVDGDLFLSQDIVLSTSAGSSAVDLSGASVRRLGLDPAQFGPHCLLDVTGLQYQLRPQGDVAKWIGMLRHGTSRYAAQPYQQYAATCLAEGHLGDYRAVLVAQQDDRRQRVTADEYYEAKASKQRRRQFVLGARRFGPWLSRAVVGYGYRPWRATWWLLAIFAAAMVLSVSADHVHASNTGNHVAYRPAVKPGDPVHDCSTTEQTGLALRLSLPLVGNVTQGSCQFTTAHRPGGLFAIAGIVLQALSWATTTLIVTGYTGIIRRT